MIDQDQENRDNAVYQEEYDNWQVVTKAEIWDEILVNFDVFD